MTNRQFHLTEDQLKELKWHEQANKRVDVARRLQAIRLYGTGRAARDIVDIVGCSETSLRDWATLYKRQGIEGRLDHHHISAQNARKLTREQEADLKTRLHQYEPRQVLNECRGTDQFGVSSGYVQKGHMLHIKLPQPGLVRMGSSQSFGSYQ